MAQVREVCGLLELLARFRILMKIFVSSAPFKSTRHNRAYGRVTACPLISLIKQIAAATDDQLTSPGSVGVTCMERGCLVDHAACGEHTLVIGAYCLMPTDEGVHAKAAHRDQYTERRAYDRAELRLLSPLFLLSELGHLLRRNIVEWRNYFELFRA